MSAITNTGAAHRYLMSIKALEAMPEYFSKAEYDQEEDKNFKQYLGETGYWRRGMALETLVKNKLITFSHKQDIGKKYYSIDEYYKDCYFISSVNNNNEPYYYREWGVDATKTIVGLIHNGKVFTHRDYCYYPERLIYQKDGFIPFSISVKQNPVFCNMYTVNRERVNEYKQLALQILKVEKAPL